MSRLGRLVVALLLASGHNLVAAVPAGVIELFPLNGSPSGYYSPGTYDLVAQAAHFGNSSCGTAGLVVPFKGFNDGTGFNPSAFEAPPTLQSAWSNLAAYTLTMDYTPTMGTLNAVGLPTTDPEINIVAAVYGPPANAFTPWLGTDSIEIGTGSFVGDIAWYVNNFNGMIVTSKNAVRESVCNHLRFVFDGSNYYIFVNDVLVGGPTAGSSGTGAVSSLYLEATDGGFGNRDTYLNGGGAFSNVQFANTAMFPGTPTPTPSPSPEPSSTPTATPMPTATVTPTPIACLQCNPLGPIGRLAQGSGSPWAQDAVPYGAPVQVVDTSTEKRNTMAWIGCAITCLAMVQGTQDPGQMDSFLSNQNDINSDGKLRFKNATLDLGYSYTLVQDPTGPDIDNALCGLGQFGGTKGYVIAEVNSSGHSHFVVITGEPYRNGTCDYSIVDPSKADNQWLDSYSDNVISLRVLVKQ